MRQVLVAEPLLQREHVLGPFNFSKQIGTMDYVGKVWGSVALTPRISTLSPHRSDDICFLDGVGAATTPFVCRHFIKTLLLATLKQGANEIRIGRLTKIAMLTRSATSKMSLGIAQLSAKFCV